MKTERKRATYTLAMAAAILGISRSAAYRAARRGQIPTLRFGNRILVARKALDRILESGTNTAGPGSGLPKPRISAETSAPKGQT